MEACKDCVHVDMCEFCVKTNNNGLRKYHEPEIPFDKDIVHSEPCELFKDRSRFVELPCKVGDTVYQTDGIRIYENKIERIIFDTNNIGFDETSIGKSIFLTREEAEQALKEREKC